MNTKTKNCPDCNTIIWTRATRCRPCSLKAKDKRFYKGDDPSMQEVLYKFNGQRARFNLIRDRARAKASKIFTLECTFCKYNLHVDIAHIKAVGSNIYSHDTKYSGEFRNYAYASAMSDLVNPNSFISKIEGANEDYQKKIEYLEKRLLELS